MTKTAFSCPSTPTKCCAGRGRSVCTAYRSGISADSISKATQMAESDTEKRVDVRRLTMNAARRFQLSTDQLCQHDHRPIGRRAPAPLNNSAVKRIGNAAHVRSAATGKGGRATARSGCCNSLGALSTCSKAWSSRQRLPITCARTAVMTVSCGPRTTCSRFARRATTGRRRCLTARSATSGASASTVSGRQGGRKLEGRPARTVHPPPFS
jgi:hypothetical protein